MKPTRKSRTCFCRRVSAIASPQFRDRSFPPKDLCPAPRSDPHPRRRPGDGGCDCAEFVRNMQSKCETWRSPLETPRVAEPSPHHVYAVEPLRTSGAPPHALLPPLWSAPSGTWFGMLPRLEDQRISWLAEDGLAEQILSEPTVSPLIDLVRNTRITTRRLCFPKELKTRVRELFHPYLSDSLENGLVIKPRPTAAAFAKDS
jgi:hypothetical protein